MYAAHGRQHLLDQGAVSFLNAWAALVAPANLLMLPHHNDRIESLTLTLQIREQQSYILLALNGIHDLLKRCMNVSW